MRKITLFETLYNDSSMINAGVGGFTPSAISGMIINRHGTKYVMTPSFYDSMYPDKTAIEKAKEYFKKMWALYLLECGDNLSRLEDALKLEYNPVENYDRMEEWTDTTNIVASGKEDSERGVTVNGKNTSTNTGNETREVLSTLTHDTEDTLTHDTEDTLTHDTEDTLTIDTEDKVTYNSEDKTTYDSKTTTTIKKAPLDEDASLTDSQQEIVKKENPDTTKKTGTETSTKTGTDTTDSTDILKLNTMNITDVKNETIDSNSVETSNESDTTGYHTGRVHGNIGVAFAVDGLNKEIEIRFYKLLTEIVDDFVNRIASF